MKAMQTFFRQTVKLAGITLLFLAGCTKDQVFLPTVGLRNIRVTAQEDANKQQVTRVHFVFPKAEALLAELRKMDATAYFEQAAQLQATYPNDLEVVEIEIAPGMTVDRTVCLKDFRSRSVLVFCNYDASIRGSHREELRKLCRKAKVLLGRNGATITY